MSKELVVIERSSLAGIVTAVNNELTARDSSYLRNLTFHLSVFDNSSDRLYRVTLLFETGAPTLTAPFELVGYEASELEGQDGVGALANADVVSSYGSSFAMQFFDWIPRDVSVYNLHVILLLTNPSAAEGAAHYGY